MPPSDPSGSGALLEAAILLAMKTHRGQVDKAGAPYILHPLRVMLRQTGVERQMAAVLHDVVEDGAVPLATIRERFGFTVADAVDALSRRENESYETFVARCAADPIARDVKRADITDNLDLSRLPDVTERDLRRAEKYRRALTLIDAADWAEHNGPAA